jgi:uncharacterized membrane protein YkoI
LPVRPKGRKAAACLLCGKRTSGNAREFFLLEDENTGTIFSAVSSMIVKADKPREEEAVTNKTKKRWMGSMLAVAISAGGILPYNVLADEVKAPSQSTVQSVKTTKISREEAIRIAKEFMAIPEGYVNNQVELEDNKFIGRTFWRLSWGLERPEDDFGQVSVSVDAQDGTILNAYQWSKETERNSILPGKLNTDKLVKEANALINKYYAGYASQMKLSEESLESFKRGGTPYMENSLYFERHDNGIPVSEQGLRISYDKKGKLRSVEFTWNNIEFESDAGVKNRDEILRLVEQELEMELAYLPNMSRPGGKIELAYAPKLKASSDMYSVVPRLFIDARTGKQISAQDGKEIGTLPGLNQALSAVKTTPPSDRNLDEAGAMVKLKELGILKDSMQVQQKGYREESYPAKRKLWEIFMIENQGDRKNVRASLDAQTGELVSYVQYGMPYDAKMGNPDKIKVNINKQQAEKTAEAFVRKVLPGRLDTLYMMEAVPNYFDGDLNKVMNYNVSFVRKENGIRVVGEGATVTVDADTGDIIDYNMTWSKQTLPATTDVIKPEEAKKKTMAVLQAELRYSLFPPFGPAGANQVRKAKPVYIITAKTKGNFYDYNASYLDARTGEWKAYGQMPVNNAGQPVTDIAGHPFERELQEMVDANLLEAKDGKVNPDQKMTRGEALKVFYVAARQPYEHYGPQQEPFFTDVEENSELRQAADWAIQTRLLPREEKQLRPNEPATREFLAELIVRGLGYGKLAAKEGVFEAKFQDSTTIQKKGEAALVTLLRIMEPNANNQFEPGRQVTKAETAVAVYRYLQTKESFIE